MSPVPGILYSSSVLLTHLLLFRPVSWCIMVLCRLMGTLLRADERPGCPQSLAVAQPSSRLHANRSCRRHSVHPPPYMFYVCVLTGLRTDQYDQIMRWWGSNPQSEIAQFLDTASDCCVLPPCRPCYSTPFRVYHTSSFAHLGVPCLRPSISAYHTRSFAPPYIFSCGGIVYI